MKILHVTVDMLNMGCILQIHVTATTYTRKQVLYGGHTKHKQGVVLKYAIAAVQSPAGDISYMLKFFRQYVGLQV